MQREPIDKTIAALRSEIETLKERICQLMLAHRGPDQLLIDLRDRLGLTYSEAEITAMLLTRNMVTRDSAYTVMFGERKDAPDPKIFDVFLCKVRPKLKYRGVDIETIWGRGWSMTQENKDRLRALLPRRDKAVPSEHSQAA